MQFFLTKNYLKDAKIDLKEDDKTWYQKNEEWIKIYSKHISLEKRYHFYRNLQMLASLPTICFLPCNAILINEQGIIEGFAIEKIKKELFAFSKESPKNQIEYLQELKNDLYYLSKRNLEITNLSIEQVFFDQGFRILESDTLDFIPTHTFLESKNNNQQKLKKLCLEYNQRYQF